MQDTASAMESESVEGLAQVSPENANQSVLDKEKPQAAGPSTSWRVLLFFAGLSVTSPLVVFTAPAVIVVQLVLGLGLAAATWVIVTYPTDKAKERLSSDRVQPEMHLVFGTLLPELAVNLEKLLLWTDLSLRKNSFPTYLRYPVLNMIAYITGPLWFALIMMAMIFFLLFVTVISFGLILPLTLPILGLLLGYALMVPVWVLSVYLFSMPPLLLATVVGFLHEAYANFCDARERVRARRMVKQRSSTAAQKRLEPSSQQHNPTQNPTQPWLTKQDLLRMYQQMGILDPAPIATAKACAPVQASQETCCTTDHWSQGAASSGHRDAT